MPSGDKKASSSSSSSCSPVDRIAFHGNKKEGRGKRGEETSVTRTGANSERLTRKAKLLDVYQSMVDCGKNDAKSNSTEQERMISIDPHAVRKRWEEEQFFGPL